MQINGKEIKNLLRNTAVQRTWKTGQTISRNVELIEKNIFSLEEENGKYNYLTGKFYISGKEYNPVMVFKNNGKQLHSYNCNCKKCEEGKKPCEHIIALFLASEAEKNERTEEYDFISNEDKDKQIKNLFQSNVLKSEKNKKELTIKFQINVVSEESDVSSKIVFSDFEVYNPKEDETKSIKLETLISNDEKIILKKLKNWEKPENLFLNEISFEFLQFLYDIERENRKSCINIKYQEVYIPDFIIDKSLKFIKKMAKNFDSKLELPLESTIRLKKSVYEIKFKNFSKTVSIGGRYLAFKNLKHGSRVNIVDIGKQNIEKIDFLRKIEINKEAVKMNEKDTSLSDIIENLGQFTKINLAENVKERIIKPSNIGIRLLIDDSSDGGLTAVPEFLYEGKTLEEYKDYTILRDANTERTLLSELKEILALYNFEEESSNVFILKNDEHLIYQFMTKYIEYVGSQYQIILSDVLKERRYRKAIPIVDIAVSAKLHIEFSIDGLENDAIEYILKDISEGKRYCRLPDRGILYINNIELAELQDIFSSLNAQPNEIKSGLLIRDKAFLPFIKNVLKNTDSKKMNVRIEEKGNAPKKIKIPKEFRFLRSYQRRGTASLLNFKQYKMGGILADDIGLGKSMQIIAFLAAVTVKNYAVIMTPSCMVRFWENEFKKTRFKCKVRIIAGGIERRIKQLEKVRGDEIIIISYESMLEDWTHFEYMNFDVMIFDEPLSLGKNREEFSRVMSKLKGEIRFCLTSGYKEEELLETYYMFNLIKSEYLGTIESFKSKYMTDTENMKKKRFLLSSLIKPYLIYRTKEKVLDELPEKATNYIFIEMDEDSKQRLLYMEYLQKLNALLLIDEERKNVSNKKVYALIERLRQTCCYPGMIKKTYEMEFEKIKAVDKYLFICNRENKKVIILTQYREVVQMMRKRYSEKYECDFIFPETSETYIEEIHYKINGDDYDNKPLFVFINGMSISAVQELEYDVIIYYDPAWERVCKNEVRRIYRKKPLEINLITKGTIEEKILDKKALLGNNVVNFMLRIKEYGKRKPKFKRIDMLRLLQL